MADTTFRTVLPPLKAVDLGDGTHSVAVSVENMTAVLDDIPVNGELDKGITSNWAYDHATDYGLHSPSIVKSADQTLTQSSTVLQSVTEMLFAIGANEVWLVMLYLRYNSAEAADLKVKFTLPSGATSLALIGNESEGGTSLETERAITGFGASNGFFHEYGIVVNGATAGNVQLQAAQLVADASDTKILANSCLVLKELA